MNVFDHQKFHVRRMNADGSVGKPESVSWKEILVSDAEYSPTFYYPYEHLNVAALGLCTALTQAFLHPKSMNDIVGRLDSPTAAKEVDIAIKDHLGDFGIDEGVRFMQGDSPERDKKGRLKNRDELGYLMPVVKNFREFLNRPEANWCVQLDQIPLLLFSRSTFFEKNAGRGYLTGTTADLEIRTFIVDPHSLRNTIWLNTLALDFSDYDAFYGRPDDSDSFDYWLWSDFPKADAVPANDVTLRAGLFWATATMWIEVAELDSEGKCIVTGEVVEEGTRCGTAVSVKSTGMGFGAKQKNDAGLDVRNSFFFHPNAPWKTIRRKKKGSFNAHLQVDEQSGVVGQMAGLLFSSDDSDGSTTFHTAPALQQLDTYIAHADMGIEDPISTDHDLLCFGFNMITSKANVHGAYAIERYVYPILKAGKDEDRDAVKERAAKLLRSCADHMAASEYILRSALQRCFLIQTDESEEDGSVTFSWKERVGAESTLRDVTIQLWKDAGERLKSLVAVLDVKRHGTLTADRVQDLLLAWNRDTVKTVESLFYPYFNDFVASPQYLLAAHDARRLLYAQLRKSFTRVFEERSELSRESESETTTATTD